MKLNRFFVKGYAVALEDAMNIVKTRIDEQKQSSKYNMVQTDQVLDELIIDILEELVYNIQKKTERFNN